MNFICLATSTPSYPSVVAAVYAGLSGSGGGGGAELMFFFWFFFFMRRKFRRSRALYAGAVAVVALCPNIYSTTVNC